MSFFQSLLGMLPQNLTDRAVTAGVVLLLRELPRIAGWLFGRAEDAALAKGSPAFDSFLLSAVKLAEAAIPAPGSGDAKYKFVAKLISDGIPQLKLTPDEADKAIEAAVAAMEAEADKRTPPAQ
jgi:hypothetical protein